MKKNKLKDLIYIQENKPCSKESIANIFRALLEPVLEAPDEKGVVLLRLNSKDKFQGILRRLNYTSVDILDFSDDEDLIEEKVWEKTEFVFVLTQRYGAVFIWDFETENIENFAGWYLLHNSINLRFSYDIIKENSNKDISEYQEQYKPDRRDNILLNNSIRKLVDALNERTQDAIIADMEKDSLVQNDDAQRKLDFMNSKLKCTVHEIRNQLSICELYTNIIQKVCENDQNESCMNALTCIKTSVQVASSCLMDLKSLNNTDLKVHNLKEIVEHAVELSKVYTLSKEIEFSLDITNNDITVLADENKFFAAMTNLIKNAIESIESNGKIKISTAIEEDFATISVANNGKQIPQEEQKHLFEEGFTTKSEGSGLGLYICKKTFEEQFACLELTKSDSDSTEFKIRMSLA